MAKIKKDTNLRKSILQAAITGQLISNVKGETKTGKELLDKIIEERNAKLLAQWEEAKKKNPKAKKPAPIVASEITEDEIPFEIPKSWCWCRLGDLVLFGECENAEPNEIEDDAWILDLEDIEKDSLFDFKAMYEEDLKSLKEAISDSSNRETCEIAKQQLYKDVTAKYDAYIPQFSDGLYGYVENCKFYDELSGAELFHDLNQIYNKMLSFKALGYSSLKEWIPQNVSMIQITNTNQNKVDINISFGTVRVLLNVSKLLRTA